MPEENINDLSGEQPEAVNSNNTKNLKDVTAETLAIELSQISIVQLVGLTAVHNKTTTEFLAGKSDLNQYLKEVKKIQGSYLEGIEKRTQAVLSITKNN